MAGRSQRINPGAFQTWRAVGTLRSFCGMRDATLAAVILSSAALTACGQSGPEDSAYSRLLEIFDKQRSAAVVLPIDLSGEICPLISKSLLQEIYERNRWNFFGPTIEIGHFPDGLGGLQHETITWRLTSKYQNHFSDRLYISVRENGVCEASFRRGK